MPKKPTKDYFGTTKGANTKSVSKPRATKTATKSTKRK